MWNKSKRSGRSRSVNAYFNLVVDALVDIPDKLKIKMSLEFVIIFQSSSFTCSIEKIQGLHDPKMGCRSILESSKQKAVLNANNNNNNDHFLI